MDVSCTDKEVRVLIKIEIYLVCLVDPIKFEGRTYNSRSYLERVKNLNHRPRPPPQKGKMGKRDFTPDGPFSEVDARVSRIRLKVSPLSTRFCDDTEQRGKKGTVLSFRIKPIRRDEVGQGEGVYVNLPFPSCLLGNHVSVIWILPLMTRNLTLRLETR